MSMAKETMQCLEVSSPEELAKLLADKPIQEGFIGLSVYGAQVLVRQFELPAIRKSELKDALRLEAVELLHIKPQEIELEYQLVKAENGKLSGIFVAAPKKLIEEYIACCDSHGLRISSMSARIISAVNSFFLKNKLQSNTFGILMFSGANQLYLAVFDNGLCVLLREINYDDLREAEQEVINSLKYSCSKSASKQLDALYVRGQAQAKEQLLKKLEQVFDVTAQEGDGTDSPACSLAESSIFKINLTKGYTVTVKERAALLKITTVLLILCLLMSAGLIAKLVIQSLEAKKVASAFNISDYEYAKGLVKALENAK